MNEERPKGPSISLVIPGRNAAATLELCLQSVVGLLETNQLEDIFFVDDQSSDESLEIAESFSVRCLRAEARGPGAARNTGWRASTSDLIWFIDADCVAEPDALSILVAHTTSPGVAAVGGSYENLHPESLLASLIHLEIVERHSRMPAEPDFLASFNVLYRREDLMRAGGFDERLKKAQDADLAFRVRELGGTLRFDRRSRVGHHHATHLNHYLATQSRQGFWRVFLYSKHPRATLGDAYSQVVDHLQPPLAVLAVVSLPLVWFRCELWSLLVLVWALTTAPMAFRLVRRARELRYWTYIPFAMLRAVARGAGMTAGMVSWLLGLRRAEPESPA